MQSQLLDCVQIPRLRQAIADNNTGVLESLPFGSISIGALLELCCISCSWIRDQNALGMAVFERLAQIIPSVRHASDCLKLTIATLGDSQFSPCNSNFILAVVSRKACFQERLWTNFQQSFVDRLKDHGFQPGFAIALSAAFGEIAENAPDHSAKGNAEMAPTMIGYFVTEGEVHFAVSDIGRGVLDSLRENPRWKNLNNSREAILATLDKRATRKTEHLEGGGFKLALKSYVDRNGILAIASGDGIAQVGADMQGRHVVCGFAPWFSGTRVAGSCFTKGHPKERAIPNFSI